MTSTPLGQIRGFELRRISSSSYRSEFGAVKKFADRARKAGVEPRGLNHEALNRLLDAAPTPTIREKIVRAVKVLQRYQFIGAVAAHLPKTIELEVARRRFELTIPDHVDQWIREASKKAGRDPNSYDKITKAYSKQNSDNTLAVYHAALRNYVWTASLQRSGAFDVEGEEDLAGVFTEDVFCKVVAFWIDISGTPGALTARSANSYVGNIMTVCSRNGIDVSHMKTAKENSQFLLEGQEDERSMSPKTINFCRPIVENRAKRRAFLTQHITYRERAEDLLATDKLLEGPRLSKIRSLGACAAFAAIELTGAPYRELNVLQLRHRGPTANIFLPNPKAPFFRIAMSPIEMKVKKKEVPHAKIRRNKLEGLQTLEWYLKTIRPLFPYGNPDWCAAVEDEPIDHIRFGHKKLGQTQTESIHLFVAPASAQHLSKSTFYDWIVSASEEIDMPLTAHNFRHGLATILLSRSFANLHKVANLLMNTPGIVQRNYAWIDKESLLEEAQDDILGEVSAW